MLGILPGVPRALALTESLIAGGCAARGIYLLMAPGNSENLALQEVAFLEAIGEHWGVSVYCAMDHDRGRDPAFDATAQQRRFALLINRFATHYPHAWEFHQYLVMKGSPVGVVHLEAPMHDDPALVRTVLEHSITRVQISDLPNLPATD